MQQPLRLGVAEKQCLMGPYFIFYLGIVGQDFAARLVVAQDLARGAALGAAVVSAFFDDHAGRCNGDLGAHGVGFGGMVF